MTTVDVTGTRIEVTRVPAQTSAGHDFARPFAAMPGRAQVEVILDRARADAERLRAVQGNVTTARLCGAVADDRLVAATQAGTLLAAYRWADDAERRLLGGRHVQIEMRPGGGS